MKAIVFYRYVLILALVLISGCVPWKLAGNSGSNPGTDFLGTTDNQPLVLKTNNNEVIRVDTAGNVGIGTTSPAATLNVKGSGIIGSDNTTATGNWAVALGANADATNNYAFATGTGTTASGSYSTAMGVDIKVSGNRSFGIGLGGPQRTVSANNVMSIMGGKVGIGTTDPAEPLHVAGDFIRVNGAGGEEVYIGGDGWGADVQIGSSNANIRNVGLWNSATGSRMNLYLGALYIMGGADFAEPFDVSDPKNIEPGMLVSIDPKNPGQLRISDKAYDKTVAGIVSGANGLKPGLTMLKEGTESDDTMPVALSGRVYAMTDASYGAVEPGDMLTTSNTPGHAMKVTDFSISNGTIVGKAMTSLKQGRGLVLVLVTLQ